MLLFSAGKKSVVSSIVAPRAESETKQVELAGDSPPERKTGSEAVANSLKKTVSREDKKLPLSPHHGSVFTFR